MNNSNNFDSLTDKLIQSGIISSNKSDCENIFQKYYEPESDEDYRDSPFIPENNQDFNGLSNKKRLNETDLNLIQAKTGFSVNTKNKYGIFDSMLIHFFPKIYKAKLIKSAMKKMSELNIDSKTLFNKTIPYGENEIHYNDLIKYLRCANELQTELSDKN